MNQYYNVIADALNRAGNPARTTERAKIYAELRRQMAETLEHSGMKSKKLKAELAQFDEAVSAVEKYIMTGEEAAPAKAAPAQPETVKMDLIDYAIVFAMIAGVAFGIFFLISLVMPTKEPHKTPIYAYDGSRHDMAGDDEATLAARAWCKSQKLQNVAYVHFEKEEGRSKVLCRSFHFKTSAERAVSEMEYQKDFSERFEKIYIPGVLERLGEFKPDFQCRINLDSAPAGRKDYIYQSDMDDIESWFKKAEADFDQCLANSRSNVIEDAQAFVDKLVEEEVMGSAEIGSPFRRDAAEYLASSERFSTGLNRLNEQIADAETALYNANVDKWNDFIRNTVGPARERGREIERELAEEEAKKRYEKDFRDQYGVSPFDNCKCDGMRTMRCDKAPCIINGVTGWQDGGFAQVVKNVANNIREAEHRERQAAYDAWLRQHPEMLYRDYSDDDDDDRPKYHKPKKRPPYSRHHSSGSSSSSNSSSYSGSDEDGPTQLFNGEPGYYYALSTCHCNEKAGGVNDNQKLRAFISNVVWYKGREASHDDQTEYMPGLFFNAMKAQFGVDNADFVYGFKSELDAKRDRQKKVGDFTSKDYQIHNVYIAD